MRNYAKMFECGVLLGTTVQAFILDHTIEESGANLESFKAAFGPGYDYYGPISAFLKMNKLNVGILANAATVVFHPFTPDNFKETSLVVYGDTPRDTWNSEDPLFGDLGTESASGYSSKPATGKKGPKGKINLSLALYLTLLWQTYLAERKYIVANQVLTELNKYQNAQVTISQVLDFLSKLPPTQ